jgi:GNAT superfamily N-acetyltransferase
VDLSAEAEVDRALEEERAFVATLGGYTLEIAGARLVTHERIPVPRFNFIQDVRVSAPRQSAFFERALDHYFQRALRPTVRVREPVAAHIDRGLTGYGFRARTELHELLVHRGRGGADRSSLVRVRRAREGEVDRVVAFWAAEREREELRRSVEVSWNFPNPDEELVPMLAEKDGQPVGAALVHGYRGVWAVHAVATQPEARGQGVASALVAEALASIVPGGAPVAMHAESRRLGRRLERLGFRPAGRSVVYDLPATAHLALPPVGPPGPPRWRPPRGAAPPSP